MTGNATPVWVLADPRAGTAAQALGIAERLGVPFRVVPLEWGPMARLPLPLPSLLGLTPAARAPLQPPWPRLVISAGRRAGPVARWLGRRGVRIVQCMRAAGRFDLSVIGLHDSPVAGPAVFPILGAAHRVTPAKLAVARDAFPQFAALQGPRVGLLLGGPIRGQGMAPAIAAALGVRVAGFGGSVIATASRRTGAAATQALAESLAGVPHYLHRWGGPGENPYLGILAWADILVVSGDSVSMVSEALMSRASVFIAPMPDAGRRHLALHESLFAAGQARPLDRAPGSFARPPLDEVSRIVHEILSRGWLSDGGTIQDPAAKPGA